MSACGARPLTGCEADRLRRRATLASVIVAATLIAVKIVAYTMTHSVSLLSSLVDSSTDLLASVVTLIGVRHALRPPDLHHRFGHGKAEALAALAQSAFIGGSAVLLSIEAVSHLVTPEPVAAGGVGIATMVFSIILTLALVTYQRWVVQRTGSLAIGADRLHYAGDLFLNGAVIAAILLTEWTGVLMFDPLFGLGIGGFLLYGAAGILRGALDVLMDRELPQQDRERIQAIVFAEPGVLGMHDLRSRSSGTGVFLELHLELDATLPLGRAHAIADRVERALTAAFPQSEVMIHQEPHGLIDERLDDRIASST